MMYGFQRIALCVPECKVADVDYNCDKILALAKQAAKENAGVVVFPELSITTASWQDQLRFLHNQQDPYRNRYRGDGKFVLSQQK